MSINTSVGQMRRISKTLTFTGAANFGQSATSATVATVTGEVMIVAILPTCTGSLTGATSTVSLGFTGSTAALIPVTTATSITSGLFWIDNSPAVGDVQIPVGLKDLAVTNDLVVESLTANTTGGSLRFDIWWMPLSSDGNIT